MAKFETDVHVCADGWTIAVCVVLSLGIVALLTGILANLLPW